MKKLICTGVLALSLCASSAFAVDKCADNGLGETFCINTNTAYNMIRADYLEGDEVNVILLDVRTPEEWKWIGYPGNNKLGQAPELDGRVLKIDWKSATFMEDVEDAMMDNPDAVLLTLCRSGGRSYDAAKELIGAGYSAYNVNDGFEGDKGSRGYRSLNGWKNKQYSYKY